MSVIENPELSTPTQRVRLGIRRNRVVAAVACWAQRDAFVLLVLALAALATAWPILTQPRTHIIGPLGDNVQYVYMTGWVAQSLLIGQSPLVDPRLNFPATLPLATTDAPFLSMLLVAPVTWGVGPVAGYNLIMVLSGIVSGYGAYLWVCQVSGSRFGGLVAGLAFVLSPFRIAQSYGHLQLISTQGLPLFFWALDTSLREVRPRLRTLMLLAAATALVGCGAQYYLLMALLTGVVYALVVYSWRAVSVRTLAQRQLKRWSAILRLRSSVLGLLSAVAIGCAVAFGALVSALPYLSIWRTGDFQPYTFAETRQWSANVSDFVLPSPLHPLWGAWIAAWFPQPAWIEHTLYLGGVALVLAAVALVWRRNQYAAYIWPWAITATFGMLFALGTDLHWNNQPLQANTPLLLPAAWLLDLPFANFIRVWTRFGIVPILFVSLLAGLGAARLQQAVSSRQKAAGSRQRAADMRSWITHIALRLVPPTFLTLIVVLLLVDLLPGAIQTTPLAPRPIDRWLAAQPGDFAVAFLPQVDDATNYLAMYGSLIHGKHLPAYNHPTHLTPEYKRFRETADRFPTTAGALHWLGLRYVLLNRAAFDGVHSPAWSTVQATLARIPSLQVLREVDGYVVVLVH